MSTNNQDAMIAVKQFLDKKPVLKQGRVVFAKKEETFKLPYLNDVQVDSFKSFLQENVEPLERKNIGFQNLFTSSFPFVSNDGKVKLEFISYVVEEKTYSVNTAIENDRNYTVPIKAKIRLILEEIGEIKEQEIFICDLPYMTDQGTFIINGVERVVVSQIHRSPGVIFDYNNRALIHHSRIIPNKGPWLEFEILKEVIYVRIDRKTRILLTFFLRALGFESNESIVKLFFEKENISIKDKTAEELKDLLLGRYVFENIDLSSLVEEKEEVVEKVVEKKTKKTKKTRKNSKEESVRKNLLIVAGSIIDEEIIDNLIKFKIEEVVLIVAENAENREVILNTLIKENKGFVSSEEACNFFYCVIRGGQPASDEIALNEMLVSWKCLGCKHVIRQTIDMSNEFFVSSDPDICPNCEADKSQLLRNDKSIFFNHDQYSLGDVGRYKINKKFDYKNSNNEQVLSIRDILSTVKHLIGIKNSELATDDIDHLGNRRIRCVGEQLVNHLKSCFVRMERLVKDRVTIQEHKTLTPQNLISIKPITAGINEFFGTSQLSQFMDQTNALSAITHKRRLSALGPGGLTRERAGFEVRDIHYTHYGRICPIETPEGPNIGLIVSLASFARVNDYGFIETPYYKVVDGKVTDEVRYLSAIEEERYVIVPANTHLNEDNSFKEEIIAARRRGDYPMSFSKDVDYIDVSSKQIVSVSASLIPFLEHDDANRALMGCNMMRQAIPLLYPDSPIVGTGLEEAMAKDSGFCQLAKEDGEVTYVDNSRIEITTKDSVEKYKLTKSYRTNQDTYYNQSPIVKEGDQVLKGDVLCDGPSIDKGEIALGKNVIVAFMTWEGYNYEDAILMSENLLKRDTYTSIHIEQLEIESRETKLGKEQITKDIPNISEEDYKELDENGIVMVGAKVKHGSILVGKVTPKSHTEITPEYRLLYSIFGEKAREVDDTSLRVPHGTDGVVIGVYHYSRENRDDLKAGVIEKIKILLATKRKLREGDKFAGRHGNKGVVARIIPQEDMPFNEEGEPVDIVLNPLGVPSRMNIGQVMETVLGYAGYKSNKKIAVPVFNGMTYGDVKEYLKICGLEEEGKHTLYDGRTGEPFKNKVTIGVMYYLKLAHLADDKIHARSTGPYSLVTQQPLGGKAQFGGQRVGEMEVWAIEAYGASNILQEFLTVKSDSIGGRTSIYEAIVKGKFVSTPGIPESFNVLVQELRGLGLNMEMFDGEGNKIHIIPQKKKDNIKMI